MPSSDDHLPERDGELDPLPEEGSPEAEDPESPANLDSPAKSPTEDDEETEPSATDDTDPGEQPESDEITLDIATPQDLAPPPAATKLPAWRRWLTIRDEPGPLARPLLALAGIAFALLVWWILTRGEGAGRILSPVKLPSIPETIASFPTLWFDAALTRSVFASLARVLSGFLLAAAVAVPLGVTAGCYGRFHAFLQPFSIFGRNVPIAALIPLTLIWFGIDELPKVMFIFLASVAFIFFDTTQSVRSVPGNYLDTAYTLGARADWRSGFRRALIPGAVYLLVALLAAGFGRSNPELSFLAALAKPVAWIPAIGALVGGTLLWLPVFTHQAISKVLFPLALPRIVNSLRLLFGLAFGYVMLAELINAKLGLGFIINMSQRRGHHEHIYLCLIVIALLAFMIDRLILWIQRRSFPYVSHAGH